MLRKVSLGLILALAGCGAAQLVHRTQYGGVLELQGDRGKAMDVASSEMAAHCGTNNYTIIQEGYEPAGPRGPGRGMAWRVHYRCNASAGAPATMPAAAPQNPPYPQDPPYPQEPAYPQDPTYSQDPPPPQDQPPPPPPPDPGY